LCAFAAQAIRCPEYRGNSRSSSRHELVQIDRDNPPSSRACAKAGRSSKGDARALRRRRGRGERREHDRGARPSRPHHHLRVPGGRKVIANGTLELEDGRIVREQDRLAATPGRPDRAPDESSQPGTATTMPAASSGAGSAVQTGGRPFRSRRRSLGSCPALADFIGARCGARRGVGRRARSKRRCLANERFESEVSHDDRKFRRGTS
jgi:hypothetical protein